MLLQKKLYTFYSGLLIQRIFEVSPGCIPCAPPKMEGGLLVQFLGLCFSVTLPTLGIFSDALACSV